LYQNKERRGIRKSNWTSRKEEGKKRGAGENKRRRPEEPVADPVPPKGGPLCFEMPPEDDVPPVPVRVEKHLFPGEIQQQASKQAKKKEGKVA
jgi:hypothetical protein